MTTKIPAFGTVLKVGTKQAETAVVVGTITLGGNATFTLTAAGMTGSPIATSVAVLLNDTADTVAKKAAAAMNLNTNITALFTVEAHGPNVVVRRKIAAANDATLNLAYTNDTCTGLTPDASSNDTVAGIALAAIAHVQSFDGPDLSSDTEDVTTHDSPGGFEEVVVTVKRTGELGLSLVFDPTEDSHDGTNPGGLISRWNNKVLSNFEFVFPDLSNTTWRWDGYVTGFKSTEPHEGALTADAVLKPSGEMILV